MIIPYFVFFLDTQNFYNKILLYCNNIELKNYSSTIT